MPLPAGSLSHSGTLRWGWKVGNYGFCPLQPATIGRGGKTTTTKRFGYFCGNINRSKSQSTVREASLEVSPKGHASQARVKAVNETSRTLDLRQTFYLLNYSGNKIKFDKIITLISLRGFIKLAEEHRARSELKLPILKKSGLCKYASVSEYTEQHSGIVMCGQHPCDQPVKLVESQTSCVPEQHKLVCSSCSEQSH